MLNHMIVWNGWIFPTLAKHTEKIGPTKSEFATFERMVLAAHERPTPPAPRVH